MVDCKQNSCEKEGIKECPYCKKHFCASHIRAAKPFLGDPYADTLEARSYRKFDEDQSHGCYKYEEARRASNEDTTKKGLGALDELAGKGRNKPESRSSERTSKGQGEPRKLGTHCFFKGCRNRDETHGCYFCHKQFCDDHRESIEHSCLANGIKESDEEPVEPKRERPKKTTNVPRLLKVTFISIIAFLLLIAILAIIPASVHERNQSNSTNLTQQTASATSYHTELENLSFSKILSNKANYYNKEVSVKGRLKQYIKGTAASGIVTQVVVDDNNSEIVVSFTSPLQKSLFTQGKTTTEVYEVNGTFTIMSSGPQIQATSIVLSNRTALQVLDDPISPTQLSASTLQNNSTPEVKGSLLSELLGFLDCKNGTKNGECSSNQPYECIAGQLLKRPGSCGCPAGERLYEGECILSIACKDGTFSPECSKNQPSFCDNGTLKEYATKCGCPNDYNYRQEGESCKKILRCYDGTEYDQCTQNKPYYCSAGQTVSKASICGCNGDDVPQGDTCVSKYMTNPRNQELDYVLRGSSWKITYTAYGGISNHLASLPRSISYTEGTAAPSDRDFVMRDLDNTEEKPFMAPLTQAIQEATTNQDDQARIAISIVQNIPYDYAGLAANNINGKLPYEVLYTNSGVCSEKAKLLAYLLRDIGYGVVIFQFNVENHDAVGIKCPVQYSYRNSGYCFVESTTPDIITYSSGNYVGVGELKSTPEIISISDGKSLDSVATDYNDAQRYVQLTNMGSVLSPEYYNQWVNLVNKYGLKTN